MLEQQMYEFRSEHFADSCAGGVIVYIRVAFMLLDPVIQLFVLFSELSECRQAQHVQGFQVLNK